MILYEILNKALIRKLWSPKPFLFISILTLDLIVC